MQYPKNCFQTAWERLTRRVILNDDARNEFLVDLQPVVEFHVSNSISCRMVSLCYDDRCDVLGEVNLCLLENWYPRVKRHFKMTSVRAYMSIVIKYCVYAWVDKKLDCVSLLPHPSMMRGGLPFECDVDFQIDRRLINEVFKESAQAYAKLRPNSDQGTVERMLRVNLWDRYKAGENLAAVQD